MKTPVLFAASLMCGIAVPSSVALSAPLFLGEQEVPSEQAETVQPHCEHLAEMEHSQNAADGEDSEVAEPFIDPPEGIGDVADDDEDDGEASLEGTEEGGETGAEQNGGEEGQENGDGEDDLELEDVTLEQCKAAGLVP